MKIIYNKIIPMKAYVAINLFGVVFTRKEYNPLSRRAINHEKIHTAQMKEILYIFFYILYAVEWLILLIKYRSIPKAYKSIHFEKEAHSNDFNTNYLSTRKKNCMD